MSKWKDSKYFKLNVVTTLFCLISVVIGIVFYSQMPEQMPIHFNAAGQVDNYASKESALFGLPIFMMVIHVICCVVAGADPKRVNQPEIMQYLVRLIVPVLSIVVQSVVIMYVLDDGINVGKVITVAVGVLFLIIGNYLPKVKRNYTIGIKVPWTLSSDENWNKTHRMAGTLMVLAAIILIISGLMEYSIIGVAALLAAAVCPMIYSFVLYKRQQNN